MTALTAHAEPLAKALTPLVRDLLLEEVRRHAKAEREATANTVDLEIMEASRAVARAADRLSSARFSGAAEGNAHRNLVKASNALAAVMHKHGRMPKGG